MATIRLDFVSQDHMVFSGDVNEIIAPGIDGQLGILPQHAPLMTVLSSRRGHRASARAKTIYSSPSAAAGWKCGPTR